MVIDKTKFLPDLILANRKLTKQLKFSLKRPADKGKQQPYRNNEIRANLKQSQKQRDDGEYAYVAIVIYLEYCQRGRYELKIKHRNITISKINIKYKCIVLFRGGREKN